MGVIFTNGLGVGTVPNTNSGWVKVTNNGGDGSISNTGTTIYQIAGPNNNGGSQWLYIKKQFHTSGSLYIKYNWHNPDAGEDWPMYEVTNVEPTGNLSTSGTHRLRNTSPDPNNETGGWRINYSAGDWVAIGVYSTDSCCGAGVLNINIDEPIFWDRNYVSNVLTTYPLILNYYMPGGVIGTYRSSITDNGPGVYSALGTTAINNNNKRVVTYVIDADYEGYTPNYWLGFGATSMNLDSGYGLGAYGNDNFGVGSDGVFWANNLTPYTGATFGTVGDIIDVAINGGSYFWYRVNGGLWNNDVSADPSTNTNGYDISAFSGTTLRPALSILGQEGPSSFSVAALTPYGLPSGYTQIAGDRNLFSFTITSASFDTNAGSGPACNNPQGELINYTGITITSTSNLSCGIYAHISGDTVTQIADAYTAAGATIGWGGYVFDVVWGPGSTVTNGIAKVAFIPNSNNQIEIISVDPSDTRYLNNDNNANNGTSLAGTFNFPATFSFRMPLDLKGGWC